MISKFSNLHIKDKFKYALSSIYVYHNLILLISSINSVQGQFRIEPREDRHEEFEQYANSIWAQPKSRTSRQTSENSDIFEYGSGGGIDHFEYLFDPADSEILHYSYQFYDGSFQNNAEESCYDCACNFGIPEPSCCQVPNTQFCQSCNEGYYLGDDLEANLFRQCIKHSCFCENGLHGNFWDQNTRPIDEVCLTSSTNICTSCNFGYHLDNDNQTCQPNICTCSYGEPKPEGECSRDNNEECDASQCLDGYHFNSNQNKCVENDCMCDFGIAVISSIDSATTCQKDQLHDCESCVEGYRLIKSLSEDNFQVNLCEPNICSCENGDPINIAGNCPVHESIHCSTCNDFYHIEDYVFPEDSNSIQKRCEVNQCFCNNGNPATLSTDIKCYNHETEQCDSCNIFYHPNIHSEQHIECDENECSCDNGEPVNNSICEVNDGIQCEQCNTGYKLTSNNSCTPNVCSCQNGLPKSNGSCLIDGNNECMTDSCIGNFEMESTTLFNCVCKSPWAGINCDVHIDDDLSLYLDLEIAVTVVFPDNTDEPVSINNIIEEAGISPGSLIGTNQSGAQVDQIGITTEKLEITFESSPSSISISGPQNSGDQLRKRRSADSAVYVSMYGNDNDLNLAQYIEGLITLDSIMQITFISTDISYQIYMASSSQQSRSFIAMKLDKAVTTSASSEMVTESFFGECIYNFDTSTTNMQITEITEGIACGSKSDFNIFECFQIDNFPLIMGNLKPYYLSQSDEIILRHDCNSETKFKNHAVKLYEDLRCDNESQTWSKVQTECSCQPGFRPRESESMRLSNPLSSNVWHDWNTDPNNSCQENSCFCTNGIARKECRVNDASDCSSCNEGYAGLDNTCDLVVDEYPMYSSMPISKRQDSTITIKLANTPEIADEEWFEFFMPGLDDPVRGFSGEERMTGLKISNRGRVELIFSGNENAPIKVIVGFIPTANQTITKQIEKSTIYVRMQDYLSDPEFAELQKIYQDEIPGDDLVVMSDVTMINFFLDNNRFQINIFATIDRDQTFLALNFFDVTDELLSLEAGIEIFSNEDNGESKYCLYPFDKSTSSKISILDSSHGLDCLKETYRYDSPDSNTCESFSAPGELTEHFFSFSKGFGYNHFCNPEDTSKKFKNDFKEVDPIICTGSGWSPNVDTLVCDCYNGYHLERESLNCQVNICNCEFGEATRTTNSDPSINSTPEICSQNDLEECASCFPGYHLNDNTICIPNSCRCNQGVPHTGSLCEINQSTSCQSCFTDYELISGICVHKDCGANGVGYYVDDFGGCLPNVCTCSNGLPVVTIDNMASDNVCQEHQTEQCGSCSAGYRLEGVKCKANTCTCENGTPKGLGDCRENGLEDCEACDTYYHIESDISSFITTNVCVLNVCICVAPPFMNDPIGKPPDKCKEHYVEGQDGADIKGVACESCEDGYSLDESGTDVSCSPNTCNCENGLPATYLSAVKCLRDNDDHCRECFDGYFLEEKKCQLIECVCEDEEGKTVGVPRSGTCTKNDANECQSCQANYHLEEKETGAEYENYLDYKVPICVKNECSCEYNSFIIGESSDLCPVENNGKACQSCFDGYNLKDNECKPNICTCSNGKKRETIANTRSTQNSDFDTSEICSLDGKEECSSCFSGYKLVGDTCAPNICQCPNGSTRENCSKDGAIDCSSCNDGYYLDFVDDTSTCRENVCDCKNGTPKVYPDCPKNDMDLCNSCDTGFNISDDERSCISPTGTGDSSGTPISDDSSSSKTTVECRCENGVPARDCPPGTISNRCEKGQCNINFVYDDVTKACTNNYCSAKCPTNDETSHRIKFCIEKPDEYDYDCKCNGNYAGKNCDICLDKYDVTKECNECIPGWVGPSCEFLDACSLPDSCFDEGTKDCLNNYLMLTYTCTCKHGWLGFKCDKPDPCYTEDGSPACGANSMCKVDQAGNEYRRVCTCLDKSVQKVYDAKLLDTDSSREVRNVTLSGEPPPNNSTTNGTVSNQSNLPVCEDPCYPSPCKNIEVGVTTGSCSVNSDGINFTCECYAGWQHTPGSKETCDKPIPNNPCTVQDDFSIPCSEIEYSKCVPNGSGDYNCDCIDFYTNSNDGSATKTPVCEPIDNCITNPCKGHGYCTSYTGPPTSFTCKCYEGWSGDTCEKGRTCKCLNGKDVIGEFCPEEGAIVCIECNDDWMIANGANGPFCTQKCSSDEYFDTSTMICTEFTQTGVLELTSVQTIEEWHENFLDSSSTEYLALSKKLFEYFKQPLDKMTDLIIKEVIYGGQQEVVRPKRRAKRTKPLVQSNINATTVDLILHVGYVLNVNETGLDSNTTSRIIIDGSNTTLFAEVSQQLNDFLTEIHANPDNLAEAELESAYLINKEFDWSNIQRISYTSDIEPTTKCGTLQYYYTDKFNNDQINMDLNKNTCDPDPEKTAADINLIDDLASSNEILEVSVSQNAINALEGLARIKNSNSTENNSTTSMLDEIANSQDKIESVLLATTAGEIIKSRDKMITVNTINETMRDPFAIRTNATEETNQEDFFVFESENRLSNLVVSVPDVVVNSARRRKRSTSLDESACPVPVAVAEISNAEHLNKNSTVNAVKSEAVDQSATLSKTSIVITTCDDQENQNFTEPVKFRLQNEAGNKDQNFTVANCIFFNQTSLEWVNDGLAVYDNQSDRFTCNVTHLTYFSLLFDKNPETMLIANESLSNTDTVAGFITLICCLITAIILLHARRGMYYVWLKKMASKPIRRSYLNLSICLILMNLNLIFGQQLFWAETKKQCLIIAIIQQVTICALFLITILTAIQMVSGRCLKFWFAYTGYNKLIFVEFLMPYVLAIAGAVGTIIPAKNKGEEYLYGEIDVITAEDPDKSIKMAYLQMTELESERTLCFVQGNAYDYTIEIPFYILVFVVVTSYCFLAYKAWFHVESDMMKAQQKVMSIKKLFILFFTIGCCWLFLIMQTFDAFSKDVKDVFAWFNTVFRALQGVVLLGIVGSDKKVVRRLVIYLTGFFRRRRKEIESAPKDLQAALSSVLQTKWKGQKTKSTKSEKKSKKSKKRESNSSEPRRDSDHSINSNKSQNGTYDFIKYQLHLQKLEDINFGDEPIQIDPNLTEEIDQQARNLVLRETRLRENRKTESKSRFKKPFSLKNTNNHDLRSNRPTEHETPQSQSMRPTLVSIPESIHTLGHFNKQQANNLSKSPTTFDIDNQGVETESRRNTLQEDHLTDDTIMNFRQQLTSGSSTKIQAKGSKRISRNNNLSTNTMQSLSTETAIILDSKRHSTNLRENYSNVSD